MSLNSDLEGGAFEIYDGVFSDAPEVRMAMKTDDRRRPARSGRSSAPITEPGPRLFAAALVVAFATLCAAVVFVPVAGAATQTVTNCKNSGSGSLPQAVSNATSGATITFATSPACSFITLTSTIDIATNLTIVGPGAEAFTVSESVRKTAFDVASGVMATISGLTIENAAIGIDNSGTLTVSGSTLYNDGSDSGGGIVNDGALTVTGSTLSKNGVDAPGEGGGAIDNHSGTVVVTDSTLSDNTASSGANGGGIDNVSGSLTITGSSLSGNNTGDGSGGGIYNSGGTDTITTSTLSGNSAVDGNGGGIDNTSGTVTITDSSLARNSADYSDGGGGIDNAGTFTITDSTLFGNSALLGGEGGAILNTGTLTLTAGTLSHNGAANSGGGIYGPAAVAATIVAMSTGGDCAAGVIDGGDNLSDDASCGFTAGTDINDALAVLAPGGLTDNGGPTKTIALEALSPGVGAIKSASACSTPDQRGVVRPTPCDIGSVELALPPQLITSASSASAKVGKSFAFTVTTTGVPVPYLSKKGRLTKHLKLVNNGNGTATISGTPAKPGAFPVVLTSTYGKGGTKSVVTQAFTVTVSAV